jgi:DNA-binding LytR/AlgR family response regulator
MMTCLIVDDEPLAIEVIKNHLEKIPALKYVTSFSDAIAASEFIHNHKKIDLLFLDIQMPDISGIELIKSLQIKPLVIFTTAYSEFALDGYELDVVDYLLKPISFARFEKSVNKALELHLLRNQESIKQFADKFIFVKSEYAMVKINCSEIEHIEGMDDYVKIFLSNSKHPVLSLSSMKAILDKLPDGQFIRVHRSFIVPIQKIKSIRNKKIVLSNIEVSIGDTYIESIQEWMKSK